MRSSAAWLLLLALVVPGCLQADDLKGSSVTAGTAFPLDAAFDMTREWSRVLIPGPYAILPAEELIVPSFDGTKIHIGLFKPEVAEGARMPVIVDAGPYYGDGDEPAMSDQTHRLGGFLIEQFVPHGFAVAQVSIRGTGLSTGCVDYMGDKEQADLDAVITFLGEAEWSNGNVGMIGRSYDGSTPWEAATFGNPHLKTIVPISGISDLQQLHFRNGTAEQRSVSLGTLYYSYGATNAGFGGPEEDPMLVPRMACTDGPQHTPMGAFGYATGGGRMFPGPQDHYWETRSFTGRVLENYQGSIFYIHGLQDWNVKPAQGVDVYNAFEGKKKALLGQWAHNYPDRPDEHENLRWDWAEMLLRWFDSELRDIPTDTGPAFEIQDHTGHWRVEPANAWPPQDAAWLDLYPSVEGALVRDGAEGSVTILAPGIIGPSPLGGALPDGTIPPTVLSFASEPFANGTLISGQPRFHVTVRSATPGSNIWAELWEIPAAGEPVWIGRAQMDLRYAGGGITPTLYGANSDILARMEFFPLDARLAPGSALQLLVMGESDENLPNPTSSELTFTFGEEFSVLQLPILDRPFVPSRWDVDGGKIKDETA